MVFVPNMGWIHLKHSKKPHLKAQKIGMMKCKWPEISSRHYLDEAIFGLLAPGGVLGPQNGGGRSLVFGGGTKKWKGFFERNFFVSLVLLWFPILLLELLMMERTKDTIRSHRSLGYRREETKPAWDSTSSLRIFVVPCGMLKVDLWRVGVSQILNSIPYIHVSAAFVQRMESEHLQKHSSNAWPWPCAAPNWDRLKRKSAGTAGRLSAEASAFPGWELDRTCWSLKYIT